jgi:hypothetical protein
MESQQIMELLLKGTGPKELLVRWKAFREERDADPRAWGEKIAARTEATTARTKAMRESMGTSHKGDGGCNQTRNRHGDYGLPRNGGAPRREKADLSGH